MITRYHRRCKYEIENNNISNFDIGRKNINIIILKSIRNQSNYICIIISVLVYQTQPTMGSLISTSSNSELRKSHVKLQAQQVAAFSGNAIKWRSWKKKTRAAIGTAGMLDILDSADYANKNKSDNETVFHLLQVATADGNAAHLVDEFESDKDGHAAYSQLVTWYEGDELTTETAEDVRSRLEKIKLDTKTTASEYINDFQLYTKQLEELGESYTPSKTVHIFLSQISDPDYETTRELCIENKYKITECIERVRSKERRLVRDRDVSRKKSISIRRTDTNVIDNNADDDFSNYKNDQGYYSIPRDIWNQLDESSQNEIKKFNGDLRKKRRRSRGNSSNSPTPDSTITQRRTTGTNQSDDNPSPNKKLRTVQFKEQPDIKSIGTSEESSTDSTNDTDGSSQIVHRNNEVISFQVRDRSE